VYTIPENEGLDSIGTVSYINSESELSEYPQNMIKKGDTYFDLGYYNNPGNDIAQVTGETAEICKQECNKKNDCDGFVFSSKTCYLKNNNMYPKSKRIINNSAKLYKRSVNLKNNNSCSKSVSSIDSQRWNAYNKKDEMTKNELCGLANHITGQREDLDNVIDILHNVVNRINAKIASLSNDDKKLLDKYGINQENINNDLKNIDLLEKEYLESKGKISNIHGMGTTSQKELIHHNYNYMLWSILAVMLVIGGMKILKR
jgi:hypothetical protein